MWPTSCPELAGTAQLWAGAEHVAPLLILRCLQTPALVPLCHGVNRCLVIVREEDHWGHQQAASPLQRPPLLG